MRTRGTLDVRELLERAAQHERVLQRSSSSQAEMVRALAQLAGGAAAIWSTTPRCGLRVGGQACRSIRLLNDGLGLPWCDEHGAGVPGLVEIVDAEALRRIDKVMRGAP